MSAGIFAGSFPRQHSLLLGAPRGPCRCCLRLRAGRPAASVALAFFVPLRNPFRIDTARALRSNQAIPHYGQGSALIRKADDVRVTFGACNARVDIFVEGVEIFRPSPAAPYERWRLRRFTRYAEDTGGCRASIPNSAVEEDLREGLIPVAGTAVPLRAAIDFPSAGPRLCQLALCASSRYADDVVWLGLSP